MHQNLPLHPPPIEHQIHHEFGRMGIRDDRPTGQAYSTSRAIQTPRKKPTTPVIFEHYNFTKVKPTRIGEAPTWAVANKTPGPFGQEDLRLRTKTQRSKKTVQDQYEAPDMYGYKRQQVDRLISDRNSVEDQSLEWVLAAIKLDKETKNKTKAMHITLKRQARTGHAPPQRLPYSDWKSTGVVDLRDQNDRDDSNHGNLFFSRNTFDACRAPTPPDIGTREADHFQHFVEQKPAHTSEMSGGKEKKVNGNDKVKSKPTIVQIETPKKHRKKHSISASESSFGSNTASDAFSDQTPDTLFSSESGYYQKDNHDKHDKHDKRDKHDKHDKHIKGSNGRSSSFNNSHERAQPEYTREHRRKDLPSSTGHERYSPEDVGIFPASGHRRRGSDRTTSPYRKEYAIHRRDSSYEDKPMIDREYPERRPQVYDRRRISSYDQPRDRLRIENDFDLDRPSDRERRLQRDQDREEIDQLQRIRLQQRLDEERQDQMDRELFERDHRDRLDRELLEREFYEPKPRRGGLRDLAGRYHTGSLYRW